MSWQPKTTETVLAELIERQELQDTERVFFSRPVNQFLGTSGVLGKGGPTGAFGTTSGVQVFPPVRVAITNLDINGIPLSNDRINVQAVSHIVEHTDPTNIDLKFIQRASNDGQRVYLQPEQGKTLTLKVGGNIDIGADVIISDNQIIELIFSEESDVTSDGGFIIVGLGGGGGLSFPILYPEDNLGTVGNQTVSIDISGATGHFKEMTLNADIGLAFNNPPAADKGFEFWIKITQDGTGGHSIITTPSALKNGSELDGLLDKAVNAVTVFHFFTGDGGTTFHGERIDLVGGGGANALNDLTDVTISSPLDHHHLQFDFASLQWINQSHLEFGAVPVASVGDTRHRNNAIGMAWRTQADDGDLEIKADIVDRFEFTDTGPTGAVTLLLRALGTPDQLFTMSQGAGAGAVTLFGVPNQFNMDVDTTIDAIVIKPLVMEYNIDINMLNNSILNADNVTIVDSGGAGRGSIFGGTLGDLFIDVPPSGRVKISEALTDFAIFDTSLNAFEIRASAILFSMVETSGSTQFSITKTTGLTGFNEPTLYEWDIGGVLKLSLNGTLLSLNAIDIDYNGNDAIDLGDTLWDLSNAILADASSAPHLNLVMGAGQEYRITVGATDILNVTSAGFTLTGGAIVMGNRDITQLNQIVFNQSGQSIADGLNGITYSTTDVNERHMFVTNSGEVFRIEDGFIDFFTSFYDMTEIASPVDPPANQGRFFTKDVGGDTRPFFVNSTETEFDLSQGGGSAFADNVFEIFDDITSSKKLTFSLATATGTNLFAIFGTADTYTFPDGGGIVIMSQGTQTIGGAKTFSGVLTFQGLSTFEDGNLLLEEPTGAQTLLLRASSMASDKTATFPDNTGIVGELNLAQIWTGFQTFRDNAFQITDDITPSKLLQFSLVSASGANLFNILGSNDTYTFPDGGGTVVMTQGNQTINGFKTFSAIIITDPTPDFVTNSIAIADIVGTAMDLTTAQAVGGAKRFTSETEHDLGIKSDRSVRIASTWDVRAQSGFIGVHVSSSTITGSVGTVEIPVITTLNPSDSTLNTQFGAINGAIGVANANAANPKFQVRTNGNWSHVFLSNSN